MNWYVVCTKPNSEIKVANALKAIGINAYCPVLKYIKQYSDRKKKVEKPVLTSYVLVNISEKDRVKVFSIPGVLRYLFWLGKPAQVRNEEIEILQNELNGYSNIPCRSNLNIGSNSVPNITMFAVMQSCGGNKVFFTAVQNGYSKLKVPFGRIVWSITTFLVLQEC